MYVRSMAIYSELCCLSIKMEKYQNPKLVTIFGTLNNDSLVINLPTNFGFWYFNILLEKQCKKSLGDHQL